MKLRQSTTVTIQLGPFVDATDGVTAETGLSPSVRVSKAGAAFAARSSATAITHDENGFYRVELNATDTSAVGRLIVGVSAAGTHAPVWAEFDVLAGQAYDAQVAGTGNGIRADVQQLAAGSITATEAPNLDAAVSSRAAPGAAMDLVANAVDAAAIATDAITNAKIAAGAITSSEAPNLDAQVSSRATPANVSAVQTALEARFDGVEGATFNTATDSLEAIRDRGDTAWTTGAGGSPITAQEVRDAMKLAPTAGAPAAGSVDEHLDNAALETTVSGLNNLSQAEAQAAAESAIGAQEPIGANVTQVGGGAVANADALKATGFATPTNVSDAQAALELRFDGVEGATFDTATDSLEAIANSGGGGGGLTTQQVRDAMKLAPSSGSAAAGSIDAHLDTIEADTDALEQRLTAARAGYLDQLASRALDKLLGFSLGQYYLDNISYDANDYPTSQRLRVFDAAKDMTTVVEGAADGADGEIARIDLVSSPVSGTVRARTVRGALT